MLMQYKNDYEKTAMGLLSLLPDFKNLANLREEMKLYENKPEFKLFLFRDQHQNTDGVLAVQDNPNFVVIRYLSLAPGFHSGKYRRQVMTELKQMNLHKQISAVPEYSYLLHYLNQRDND